MRLTDPPPSALKRFYRMRLHWSTVDRLLGDPPSARLLDRNWDVLGRYFGLLDAHAGALPERHGPAVLTAQARRHHPDNQPGMLLARQA